MAVKTRLAIACLECGSTNNISTSIKVSKSGRRIRRFRKCQDCGHTFRTTQLAELHDDDARFWHHKKDDGKQGCENHNSAFTEENIRDIREDFQLEEMDIKSIATKYGVHRATIERIVKRQTYKNVA